MNTKKLTTAILAIALALSLFACGETPEETTSNNETTGEATTVSTTKETTEETTEETTKETTEETTVTETENGGSQGGNNKPQGGNQAQGTENTETETSAETETETATEATTESSETETDNDTDSDTGTEDSTRFDYFGADMEEYVSLESGALESIELEISSEYLIDENDVKEYVDSVRLQHKTPLNNGATVSDQPIKLGDTAYIYYKGYIDGEEFEGGSHWTEEGYPYNLEIGSGYFIDEFEDALIGVTPTDTTEDAPKQIDLVFPEDYWMEEYASKNVTFYVWVVHTVQYELPEYNEDFVLNVIGYVPEEGCTDVIAEFEATILAELKEESAFWEEYEKEAALGDYLMGNITVIKYPESELEHYYNEIVSQLEEAKAQYESYGETFDSLGEFAIYMLGLEEGADWQAALMDEYVYPMVEQHLIIHIVSQELDITVTDEDRQAFLEEYAEESGMTAEEIIVRIGGEYMLKEQVLYEKVIEALLERAEFYYA